MRPAEPVSSSSEISAAISGNLNFYILAMGQRGNAAVVPRKMRVAAQIAGSRTLSAEYLRDAVQPQSADFEGVIDEILLLNATPVANGDVLKTYARVLQLALSTST